MRRDCLMLLSLGAGLAIGTPALAQQTAESLIREAMAQRGFHSGINYDSRDSEVFQPDPGNRGLVISETLATGGGQGTYLSVLRNTTDTAYCIRMNAVFSPESAITGRMQGNYLVEPRQHQVMLAANTGRADTQYAMAFWPPDRSRSRPCSDVAPEGLEAWASSPPTQHFRGSIRD